MTPETRTALKTFIEDMLEELKVVEDMLGERTGKMEQVEIMLLRKYKQL